MTTDPKALVEQLEKHCASRLNSVSAREAMREAVQALRDLTADNERLLREVSARYHTIAAMQGLGELHNEIAHLKALGEGLAEALREAVQGYDEMDSPHPTAWNDALADWETRDA